MLLDESRCDLERAFLAELVASPGDPTTLAVYADFLMDQPEPTLQARGEYLRLETQLSQGLSVQARSDLHWRSRQLWWAHVEDWLGPLFDAVDHFLYERGQLSIEVSQSTLRKVDLAEVATAPAWNWVTDLVVRRGNLDLLHELMQVPKPAFLRSLDVGRRSLDENELSWLLEQNFWEGIEELDLHGCTIGNEDAESLANWPGAKHLRKLDLSLTRIGFEGAETLARSVLLSGLTRIDLSCTETAYLHSEDRPTFACEALFDPTRYTWSSTS